ncbi:zinc-ribbon domain-containing protein [Limosilactobacillus sp. BG-MG3-A]|uniref:Zinc-ribbon domain-containing protein n=1 Tax=Limosilactobacillus agrestis TaxID=2759748 RepID=A0A7W3UIL5_9LACO|nr:zinc ribbon domain-containing protein [Limosilactobacillus agrestis]MBB1096274.1 zinc-ribbon domain-containing protein [Limosilactobacillus agrestis]
MKFCPKCGKKKKDGAKFCSNCGYSFTQSTNTTKPTNSAKSTNPRNQQAVLINSKKNTHKLAWLIGLTSLVIVVCIIGGTWLFFGHKDPVATNSSTAVAQSTNTNTQSNNTTVQNSTGSTDTTTNNSVKLSSDIGPRETAAAIAYYADQTGLDGWDGYLADNNGITVILNSNDTLTNLVAEKGQGMVYGILNEQHDYTGVTKNVYTIDEDNTVNIYNLSSDDSRDSPAVPLKSVSKDEIIEYINDHGFAPNVKKLGSKVILDQE